MKICMVNNLYPPYTIGGAERSTSMLVKALRNAGHEIVLITLHDANSPLRTIDDSGVVIYHLPIWNLYWPFDGNSKPKILKILWHVINIFNIPIFFSSLKILYSTRPQVVHCNVLSGLSTSVWVASILLRIPIVQTLRDYSLICSRSTLFRCGVDCTKRCPDCAMLTSLNKWLSKYLNKVVGNSQYTLNAHQRVGYFRGVRSSVVFNIADAVSTPKKWLTHPACNLTFGAIGRVELEKGIEDILLATQMLTHSNWRLVVAGKGKKEYISKLKDKYRHANIEWLGQVNAEEFYTRVDVVVVASIWAEPLPRTLIEAYAYGCSAICSDAGGIPEIATLGRVFKMYSKGSAVSLAKAMDSALNDTSAWKSGGFASPTSEELFSSAEISKQYVKIYDEISNGQN